MFLGRKVSLSLLDGNDNDLIFRKDGRLFMNIDAIILELKDDSSELSYMYKGEMQAKQAFPAEGRSTVFNISGINGNIELIIDKEPQK